jgi:hypothetical protein
MQSDESFTAWVQSSIEAKWARLMKQVERNVVAAAEQESRLAIARMNDVSEP